MSNKGPVPDAWDEDWESSADKLEVPEKQDESQPRVKLSQKQRRAQHAEFNRQLWKSAEQPTEPMIFLQTRDDVPLKTAFKPSVTLLSRKPPTRHDAMADMAGLNLQDEDDSEEERRKRNESSFAERQARAQKERAEKERKYAEARERLFGSPAPSDDVQGRASPNKSTRGKGRGRGGRDSQPRSNEQSPARLATSTKQLYEPSYSPKPNSVYLQKKESSRSRPSTPSEVQQPIREPRGPQPIGKGGRGFAPRGNHAGSAV